MARHDFRGARTAHRPSAGGAAWAASRIAIRSCHAPTMRRRCEGAVGSTASVIDGGRDGRHRVGSQKFDGVVNRGSPPAEVLGDHGVETEDRRVHRDAVDLLEMRNQCRNRTSHGHSGYRDRGRLRPQPSHEGADLRDDAHHPCDVGQRVHVRIRRPRGAARPVTRLDRKSDVEAQLVPDAPGPGEQQVDRLALACTVHPHQPRPAVVASSAQMRDRGRRAAEADAGQRAAAALARGRTSTSRRSAARGCDAANRFHLQGFRARYVPARYPAPTAPRPRPHTSANVRSSLGGGAVSVMPDKRQLVEHHLAELAGADRRQRIPSHRSFSTRHARAAAHRRNPGRSDTRVPRSSSRELEACVAGVGDLVAPSAILRDSAGIAHVHPFLAGHVAAVVPGVAGRMDEHRRRDQRRDVLDPFLLRLGQRLDRPVVVGRADR